MPAPVVAAGAAKGAGAAAGAGGSAGSGAAGEGAGAQAAGSQLNSAAIQAAHEALQGARAGGQVQHESEENARSALAALLAGLTLSPLLVWLVVISAFVAIIAAISDTQYGGEGGYPVGSGIPQVYWPMYEAAGGRYGVNKYLLASIHKHETTFSRNPAARSGSNFAGAMGPMQFLGGTWQGNKHAFHEVLGVRPHDARGLENARQRFRPYPLDRRSLPSCGHVPAHTGCVYDDLDAISGAAHYLRSEGADNDLDSAGTADAVWAYNHSVHYRESVLSLAREWERLGAAAIDSPHLVSMRLEDTKPRTLERVIAVANAIEAERLPYCWGGGHGPEPGPSLGISYCNRGHSRVYGSSRRVGLDCSGSTRWLLVLSGFADPGGIAARSYGGYLRPGRGTRVTFYYSATHIWVEIAGRSWQTSSSNPDHGPGWTPRSSTAGYRAGHVEGL